MKRKLACALMMLGALLCAARPGDGRRTLHIFTTNDIHGHYFDSTYVGSSTQGSLLAVSRFINEKRAQYGRDNVILLDGGDFLQGDNAAYYHNYVDTQSPHIYALMAAYMGYDAVTVGNHDIEAGPAVYNRLKKELAMPLLAANAVDRESGKCHFQEYTILKRGGLRIAVIGLTNPNMRAWLDEDKLDGMDFIDPMNGFGQQLVDRVKAKEKPDAIIFVIHSGTGDGNGKVLESQGLDLVNNLKGVDLVVTAHDHNPLVVDNDVTDLINAGSHCNVVGHAALTFDIIKGKVAAKDMKVENINIDKGAIDTQMAEKYHSVYSKVQDFSTREIGRLEMELKTNDAFRGMNPYLNFVHSVCLEATGADICFAAPLKYNGSVQSGKVIYNDLFTIYPYENQLFVITMTGQEVKNYLEASYDGWINSVKGSGDEPLLKIVPKSDARTGQESWSFVNRSYNFDSASGINYTVDVTAPKGSRISISSMADGTAFDPQATYKVTTTSYRVNGGGGLMAAAGIPDADPRIIAKEKEIRDMVYDYFRAHGSVSTESISDPKVIGSWKFVPADVAEPLLDRDMERLFKR